MKSPPEILDSAPRIGAASLRQDGAYEVQTFPWSGLAPCSLACASDM